MSPVSNACLLLPCPYTLCKPRYVFFTINQNADFFLVTTVTTYIPVLNVTRYTAHKLV